jgi:hypothetical protein
MFVALLLFTACTKRSITEFPAAEALSRASISLTWDTIGAGEMVALLTNQTFAKVKDGEPGEPFKFQLSATNGLYYKDSSDLTGSGSFDSSGHATIPIPALTRYNDGELILKVSLKDTVIIASTFKQASVIRTYRDFMFMHYPGSKSFVQSRDLAFPDTTFTGAPNNVDLYSTYDGQGHRISNLKIINLSKEAGTSVGLFSYADGAVVKNLRLELKDTGIYVNNGVTCGGLIGFSTNSKIINCTMTGNVNSIGSTPICGGLIGQSVKDTVIACGFKGSLTGYACGGIMGSASGSVINLCYGYWNGSMQTGGGLVGYSITTNANIANSYAYTYSIGYNDDYFAIRAGTQTGDLTNVFACNGLANPGVIMLAGRDELFATVTSFTLTEWPAGVIPPADHQPFKNGDIPKLWWE